MNSRARALTAALFFLAFGYSLLSVCLYRVLAFTLSGTSFFVLYVATTMPFGAYLAQRRGRSADPFGAPVAALCALAFALPFIGWLATRGSMTLLTSAYPEPHIDLSLFWRRLLLQLITVAPIFVAWGYAEFLGYRAALEAGSRVLRLGFYLIFVWALACAFAAGFWLIPRWGLLRTLAVVPFAAALARHLGDARPRGAVQRAGPYLAAAAVLLAVGPLDARFVQRLFVNAPYNLGEVLDTHRLPWGGPVGDTSILASVWGKYTHFTLVRYDRPGATQVLGAYDGVVYWQISPERKNGYGPMNAAVFDQLPDGSDVAILGAGGGHQVSDALERRPRRIVAVDLVPEVFTLLDGAYAWANGNVFRSPVVETVAADGRSYLESTDRAFDAILLPHTESALANTKTLFEVGSRLHSVEAFRAMRARLKPHGIVASTKAVDVQGRLFNRYAASLREAGFHVVGWTLPSQGLQTFLLIASPDRAALTRGARVQEYFARSGFRYVDFDEMVPSESAIYDTSPWALGVLGTMIPIVELRWILAGIAVIAGLAVLGVTVVSLRRREVGETAMARLRFVLAGVAVGAHAATLQNAVIFWLLVNLVNPLAAFFLGTAAFLLAWGFSSALIRRWFVPLAVGGVGIAGLFFGESWNGSGTFVSLGCLVVGSGLCFPLLGLTFESRLLNLFVADAIGGFAAGALGILIPILLGFGRFFAIVPWISLLTVGLVVLVVVREAPSGTAARVQSTTTPRPPERSTVGIGR